MEKCIDYILAFHLRRAGFEGTTKRALHLFNVATVCTLRNYLRTLKSITIHSQRAHTTILDVLKLQTLFKTPFITDNKMYYPMQFAEEPDEDGHVPCSGIGVRVEKFVHIYDFMPVFPPAHTFKKSFPKESGDEEERGRNIKRRLEESLVGENNLVRMMDACNEIPDYVNFMRERK